MTEARSLATALEDGVLLVELDRPEGRAPGFGGR